MATLVTFLVKILAMAVLGAQAARKRILDPGTDAVRAGPAFECLNGKNPATLSKKDILKEFARGKCSPMLVIPGLLSTKLLVRIKDCHALRDDFPDLFSACGFNACEKKWDEFWKKVPASEYTSWIPDVFSPLSIFAVNQSSNFCFARFIKQQLDFTKPIEDALVSNSAFEVGLYGNSARTAKFLGCGDGSVVDLLPTYYQTKETKTFGFFFQRLAGMGHVAGLTYQTLPYDFGKSYRNSEVNKSFADNLLRLFEFSGKKVTIVGHSYGNLNALHQLSKLSTELKQKVVKTWVVVTPPFLGSLKVQKVLLSGDDDFIFLDKIVGLHVKASIEGLNNILANYVLSYKDAYSLYKGAAWFDAVVARTDYEHGRVPFEASGFPFLPRTDEPCSPANFVFFSPGCSYGLADTSKKPYIQIMDDAYMLSEFDTLLTKWNRTATAADFLKITDDPEFLAFKNPEVPVVLITMRTALTYKRLNYTGNITTYVEKGVYFEPVVTWGAGDGTVPVNSAVIPPLKWAFEFDSKTVPNARPVKFVDICSLKNQRQTVFDVTADGGEFQITANEYIGMNCECMNLKTPDLCSHASVLTDKFFIDLVTDASVTNEVCADPNHDNYIDQLDDGYLEEVVHDCPQIKF